MIFFSFWGSGDRKVIIAPQSIALKLKHNLNIFKISPFKLTFLAAFWFCEGSSILMYLMADTLKRWEWIPFLWHISRGRWYKACLSMCICMDSRSVGMIYTSTLCLQDSKGLFKYSCLFFLFYSLLVRVMCWEECQSLKSFILSFILARGKNILKICWSKLFTFSHNMSNNCKAVCSNA